MGEISVRFEALEAGADGIRTNYARLTSTIEQLESDLQPMIATWSGAARESYLACQQQWDSAATAMAQVLNTIGRAVEEARQNYTAAESAARANWS